MNEPAQLATCTRSANEKIHGRDACFHMLAGGWTGPDTKEGSTFKSRKDAQRALDARPLLRARRKTPAHIHGRTAANHANRPSENLPSESTNRSIGGSSKLTSSEIAFTTPRAMPCASAAWATAAASISTARAPNDSLNFAFCAGLATDAKLTSTPSLPFRATLLPSLALTTRPGRTISPTLSEACRAPAKPAE